jgi:hypothetical protein
MEDFIMTIKEAYEQGRQHAEGIGEAMVIELGEACTEDEYYDACSLCEDNARQFTPFEFIAHDINTTEYPDEIWESFDQGIIDVFAEDWERLSAGA